jgi:hypothetical protein
MRRPGRAALRPLADGAAGRNSPLVAIPAKNLRAGGVLQVEQRSHGID